MRVLIAGALLAAATAAGAQPHPTADAHARRGVALYNLGKYQEAIEEFEAAYQEFQSDALLFNLAQAHRKLEHCERALTYYHQFLAGQPPPALAQQVEKLLPELEAACRTRDARPDGPATTAALETRPTVEPNPAATATSAESVPPAEADDLGMHVTASVTLGEVISGGNAPITGIRATATWPAVWLGTTELGFSAGAGALWRAMDRAALVQVAAVIAHPVVFDGGRLDLAGEVGAEYISLLGVSRDVVPGVAHTNQWAPLVRGEVGIEHDISPLFALRAAVAGSLCPKLGALEAAVGELDSWSA